VPTPKWLNRAALVLTVLTTQAEAADEADLRAIRAEIQQLRQHYEQRINELEQRLQQAEARPLAAEPAVAAVPPVSATVPVSAPAPGGNAFNPEVSLILSGTYGTLQRDPARPVTGFALAANNPGFSRGFSLGETQLGLVANVDPQFRGVATMTLAAAGGVVMENAFLDLRELEQGFKLRVGRFFSGLGYLNQLHAHAWDFVDQPLVYRTFWDNQLGEDGVQLKWLAPTDTFVELGAELGRGRSFPGTNRQKNGNGATAVFAHVGDDIGSDHSWQAGASWHQTRRDNAVSSGVPDLPATVGGVTDVFSGDSRTLGLDFIWKYAPNGNLSDSGFKLQGEWFRRREAGLLTYNQLTTDRYTNTQAGWYLQGVYQFMPHWRAGLRYDQLDPGVAQIGALNAANVISQYGFLPQRATLMVDYNPSEFSRLRLQMAQDRSRIGWTDNQLFLQYIMNLGAHDAHSY